MAAASTRPRTTARTAVVWHVLLDAVARLAPDGGSIRVLDAGGGSGGFAVPLAQLGHPVTVVDPSPDSLAALERRAAETDTSALVTAMQGDAAGLAELVVVGEFDLVLCHSVLEVVDDPQEAMAGVARVLRPGGLASILAVNRVAAVLARVAAGRLAEARRMLDDPQGWAGEHDPLARRFSLDELRALATAAGLVPQAAHAVRVFTDVVPAAALDGDPDVAHDLLALEEAVAEHADYLAIASRLHLLAGRP